jgi:glycosyltransferase involved in cell wall biosynthesis
MNIGMIISTPFPPEEGIGNYIYGLSTKFIKKGHKVTIITRGSIAKTKKENIEGINIIKAPFIPIYPFYIHLHGVFVNKIIKSMESKFDILHIHSPLTPIIKTSIPIIATIHTPMLTDTRTRFNEARDIHSRIEKFMGRYVSYYIEKALIERAEIITTVANSVVNELREYGINTNNIKVLGNGVDEKLFSPSKKKNKDKYILYTGRLDYRKGLFDLIESSKYILKTNKDISFVIIGKGALKNKLQKKVEKIGIQKNFKFLGFVNQEKLIELYQNATLYVLPSHYEGLPTVLLEAMSCGLPVVATSVSGNLDVIKSGKNGILVPPKSPLKLANAVLKLLDDEETKINLGKNARRTIEDNYTWNIITDNYLKYYKIIIESYKKNQ